ncbi:MAG: MFS transporter [Holosporales bacterium]|jgi:predicted MFS family arabinose efflux permease|nr:MFS transporter [Holosporales bacterium]
MHNKSAKTTSIIMWLVVSFFYAYQYILRVLPSAMLDDIMLRFNIDALAFGQFSGVYYIGYSLIHIPLGIWLDRFGPKKVIPICILLSAVGVAPIIFAESWIYPIIGRTLTGIGSSAAILGVFKVIRMAFDERRFTRMLSFSVTIGLMGAIYGSAPLRSMYVMFGYKVSVSILILLGIILAVLAFVSIPKTENNSANSDEKPQSMFANVGSVFSNLKVMIICFSAGLMVGPLEGFADIWGPKFLTNAFGIESSSASYITAMIFVGMCFGSPILNFIAEKTKSYLGTVILSGILMFAVFVMLIAKATTSLTIITVGFIIVGICSAYQILAIYKASTYVDENATGIATAMANMIIMIFGYALHGLIGGTINVFGGIDNAESALCYGVAIIPITLLIGTIGFIFLAYKDRQSKSINK